MAHPLLLRHDECCGPSLGKDACLERASTNLKHLGPFGKCMRLSAILEARIVALVVCLLLACGPAAVFGRVGTIVIPSINRMLFGGSLAHVSEEVFKLQPALANNDAASTVVLPSRMVRVGASLTYTAPSVPLGCFGSPMSEIVRCDPILAHVLLCPLSAIASATDHLSRTQRNLEDGLLATAIAMHSPARRTVGLSGQIWGSGSHDKSTETLSFEVHLQHVAENVLRGQA